MKHFYSGENVDHLQEHLSTLVGAASRARIKAKLFLRICYRQYLVENLTANNFNICKTAIEIGVHRNSLTRQIHDHEINLHAMRDAGRVQKKPASSERPYTIPSRFGG